MKIAKKKDIRYFNFPIQLLEGFLLNKDIVLENIRDYAIYEKAQSLTSDSELQNGKDALDYFGVFSEDLDTSLKVGKLLYNTYPKSSPKVGLNKDIWIKYYNKEKSEFENIIFLAFLALKSIIGMKSYYKIVNLYWLSRMDGKTRSIKSGEELSQEIFKYYNEYQTGKIKRALEESWNLTTYSHHHRGFYVSFSMTLEDLVYTVEKQRKSNKDLDYKAKKKEAREKALERLKGEQRPQHDL